MQILEYDDPRRPGARGRCLAHPHVFGRQLGVSFYEIADHRTPSIAQAAEAVATSYLRLIPGRDPNDVLWLDAWPPETCPSRAKGGFLVTAVTYRWLYGQARSPMWWAVEPALAATVRRLWYRYDGPALAAAVLLSCDRCP